MKQITHLKAISLILPAAFLLLAAAPAPAQNEKTVPDWLKTDNLTAAPKGDVLPDAELLQDEEASAPKGSRRYKALEKQQRAIDAEENYFLQHDDKLFNALQKSQLK